MASERRGAEIMAEAFANAAPFDSVVDDDWEDAEEDDLDDVGVWWPSN